MESFLKTISCSERIKRMCRILLMMISATILRYLRVLQVLWKAFATSDEVCNGGCITLHLKTNTTSSANDVDFNSELYTLNSRVCCPASGGARRGMRLAPRILRRATCAVRSVATSHRLLSLSLRDCVVCWRPATPGAVYIELKSLLPRVRRRSPRPATCAAHSAPRDLRRAVRGHLAPAP